MNIYLARREGAGYSCGMGNGVLTWNGCHKISSRRKGRSRCNSFAQANQRSCGLPRDTFLEFFIVSNWSLFAPFSCLLAAVSKISLAFFDSFNFLNFLWNYYTCNSNSVYILGHNYIFSAGQTFFFHASFVPRWDEMSLSSAKNIFTPAFINSIFC